MNALELHNVTKRFGEKVIANDHVSLTVRRGEILAVLGENGSGKTTLMNMIAGIYRPTLGQILIDGEPQVFRSPNDAAAKGIGMVHQEFMLYPDLTVHLTLFHAAIPEGEPRKLEHNDLRWITVGEMDAYPFCPADETILQKLRELYGN